MRIAYFTDTYVPQVNGASKTLDKLGEYLREKNINHMFFAPDYPSLSEETSASPVKRFKSISFPIYPECRLSIPLYHNLARIADEFRPDLVHLITPSGIGLMGLKYARERNITIVSSFHTYFDAYLKYYKLEFLEDMVWKFFEWFHSFCSINFCPSLHTARLLESKGIKNLKIWARGINTDKFSPDYRDESIRKQVNPDNKILFLYVGRIAVEKDLDILMESIKCINQLYPGKAQFVFTGDGPYTKTLKRSAPNNVVFTGYLKGLKLSQMYASCDVFLFPSSTETFGNVILEAMASGLPVVTANAGGVTDSILHKYNGLLCKPRDVESFVQAISLLIENKDLMMSMGINAREYALSKTWESVFGKLMSDYSSLLQEKKRENNDLLYSEKIAV